MKIGILGAGAMGSWFGGRLALAGHEVSLLTTNDLHRDAIRKDGLVLKSASGRQTVFIPALKPSEFNGGSDVIILFTKTFQSDAALSSISSCINQDTHILTLQNGLGNAGVISRYVSLERVMVGVTMVPVDKVGPGIVQSTGEGKSYFNSYLAQPSLVTEKLSQAFVDADLDVTIDSQIHHRIWSKVAFNAGMNAVCALVLGTPGTVGDLPEAQSLVNDVASEVVAVAAAEGIDLDIDAILMMIDYACKNHRDHKPSMHQDLINGRRTEVDSINGAVVEAGRKHGVPTPLNAMLRTLVHLAEQVHQKPEKG